MERSGSGPYGILVSKDSPLLVAEFFPGDILERDNQGWKIIAKGHRSADGIQRDARGRLYVSEVLNGNVWRYEKDGSGKTALHAGAISPADILVDEKEQILLIPDTKAGKMIIMPL